MFRLGPLRHLLLFTAAVLAAGGSVVGCGGAQSGRGASAGAIAAEAGSDLHLAPDRPAVAAIVREGDPVGAVGVAVVTRGVAGREHGAEPAVALAALVEGRLGPRLGPTGVSVVPAWDGYRVRARVASGATGASVVELVRAALLAPVTAADVAFVRRKLDALARRPLPDPGLEDVARCRGEPYGLARPSTAAAPPGVTEIEAWRRAAHGLGRVALAVVGAQATTDDVVHAVAAAPAWPAAGTALAPEHLGGEEPLPVVHELHAAAGDLETSGEARVMVAFRVADPSRAVRAAAWLGEPRGPLVSRLRAGEPGASVREIVATAHPMGGGCLAVTLGLRELGARPLARVASAVALTRQEATVEIDGAPVDPKLGGVLARRAGDAGEAAELAAWWALVAQAGPPVASTPAGTAAAGGVATMAVAVGFPVPRDATAASTPSPDAVKKEIDATVAAFRQPVVDARVKVEHGQSDLWLLVASPCGTLPEVEGDAGLGAAFAVASADEARRRADAGIGVEPWATWDAVGIVAHAPFTPGEPPAALARRVADAAARSFAADPLDTLAAARVRASLLGYASRDVEDRALVALGNALVPGHPSWIVPSGTPEALGRSSDGALLARAASLRAGPLRVSVLANVDAAQGAAAVAAVDRWVARRPGEVRACPQPSTPAPPRPGTYAVDAVGVPSEALVAVPLAAGDAAARANAEWIAAALDGPGGLLARALGSAGLARAWSARVVGPPRGAALVVRVTSGQGALDAAVAQIRALYDRLRQGAMSEADRQRAQAARAQERVRAALDPRGRLLALWRGEPAAAPAAPTLDALRAFAASTLKDDALVIVAARPPRPTPPPGSPPPSAPSSPSSPSAAPSATPPSSPTPQAPKP